MKIQRFLALGLVVVLSIATCASAIRGADVTDPQADEVKAVKSKAIAYLKKHQQPDGSFGNPRFGPGVTALVVAAMLRHGVSPTDPAVVRGLAFLESKVQKDGGVYDKGLANYTTSVALLAFHDANKDGKYDTLIKNAVAYLKKLQFDDTKVESGDARFGGNGYDERSRPDMSNTQMFLDALIAAGVSKDDPAVQRAMTFISRCQNLSGESNNLPYAQKTTETDKGGIVYTPFVPTGDSPHKTAEGGLRSLGAMTYGGLKSFLYAGVSKEDPRVKAALGWIRRNYTLNENPGQGQSGLFYYYHTFAKAMAAWGEDPFVDASGTKHDWRAELFDALKKRQQADGSWSNRADRAYGESDPTLATAFALLALKYCETRSR